MNPYLILSILILYFLVLLGISQLISKKSKQNSFYTGDRKSPWYIVAFGMIGATLSGVTFISVPGEVGNSNFHYLQFVFGNLVGYIIIAIWLLPFYYKKNVISIYSVLEEKTGKQGYQTTSALFIVSKLIGASFRLFLAALVLHLSITEPLGIAFEFAVLFCLILIWLYTFRSGIKTVVWSDALQTLVLLTAAIATIFVIFKNIDIGSKEFITNTINSGSLKLFNWDWRSSNFFLKQFIAGIFMTIALNGFDQDIIQKNLTCENGSKARKNMLWFSVWFVIAVTLFLFLGAILYQYSSMYGIQLPTHTDQVYPFIALNHLGKFIAVLFVLGISAAAFSSADSAITAITTAVCIDFIKIEKRKSNQQFNIRNWVHALVTLSIFFVIVIFYRINNDSVVVLLFKAAGYTYGPILGIFLFTFFSKKILNKQLILPISLLSPLLTYGTSLFVSQIGSYQFGFELIVINSAITLFLLRLTSKRNV